MPRSGHPLPSPDALEPITLSIAHPTVSEAVWPNVVGYELLGQVGRGGMGIVYKARQIGLGRIVALKTLGSGLADDAELLARFRTEAAALAQLQHPNIVQVHEIGTCSAGPYFTMEFAAGGNLAEHWKGQPQPAAAAARLLATLARAIHAAHERGIIHRDLKPANILIQLADDRIQNAQGNSEDDPPTVVTSAIANLQSAIPKITDFGLARRIDDAGSLTLTGQVLGTPGFMAPEQASGLSNAVGPAVDIYALGALLYVALTGGPPYRGTTGVETVHLMLSHEPVPPSRLRPEVPRDLDTICLKCLEKEPQRRYASARDLADDLDRFCAGEPIRARPIPAWEHAWKWMRRRPATAALAFAVVAVALVGFALVFWQWRRAEAAYALSEEERERVAHIASAEARARREAQRLSSQLLLERGVGLCEAGDCGPGLLWLMRSLEVAPEDDIELRHSVRQLLGGWRGQLHPLQFALTHSKSVNFVAFSHDGRVLVTVSRDQLYRWDATNGESLGPPLPHSDSIDALALSPTSNVCAIGCRDGTVRQWDTVTGQLIGNTMKHAGRIRGLAFAADGKRLLTGSDDGTARLWDALTGEPTGEVMRHAKAIRSVAFSQQGRALTGSDDGTARLWDDLGRPVGDVLQHDGSVRVVIFSRDGRLALTGGQDGSAKLWDAVGGHFVRGFKNHSAAIYDAAFSPDGRLLATASEDHRVLLSEVDTGVLRGKLRHQHRVRVVVFSPNGRLLATASEDGTARLWNVATAQQLGVSLLHRSDVNTVAFSPDGKALLTGSDDGTARLWGVSRTRPMDTFDHGHPVFCLAVHPDGKRLLVGNSEGTVFLWDLTTHQARTVSMPSTPIAVDFRSDGKVFLVGCWDGNVYFRDTETLQSAGHTLAHATPVTTAAFSPDGRLVATGCDRKDPAARIWEYETGRLIHTMTAHGRKVSSVAFSHDGRSLLTGGWDKTVLLWDVDTGKPRGEVMRHQDFVQSVAFNPNGRLVLSGGDDFTARLWDAVTGKSRGLPLRHPDKIESVAFSADGHLIATGSRANTAWFWETATSKPLGPPLPANHQVHPVAFSADGRSLFVGSWDNMVRRWPVPQPWMDDTEAIKWYLHVHIGQQLDAGGAAVPLDAKEWTERYERMFPRRPSK
jgi:WD40 repeat protein